MRWSDSIPDSMDMNLSKLWEIVEDRGACWVAESDTTWQLNNKNNNTVIRIKKKKKHTENNSFIRFQQIRKYSNRNKGLFPKE